LEIPRGIKPILSLNENFQGMGGVGGGLNENFHVRRNRSFLEKYNGLISGQTFPN